MSRPIRKPTIKKLNVRRSEQRADREQQQAVAHELRGIVTRVTGAWSYIQKQAADYGRGYPSGTLGGMGGGSDTGTIVERNAVRAVDEPHRLHDPGHRAELLLAAWSALIDEARRIDDQLTKLIPMSATEQDEHRGRQNNVEVCVRCDEPIIDGKIVRVDNEPMHKNTCYYQDWRQKQQAKNAG